MAEAQAAVATVAAERPSSRGGEGGGLEREQAAVAAGGVAAGGVAAGGVAAGGVAAGGVGAGGVAAAPECAWGGIQRMWGARPRSFEEFRDASRRDFESFDALAPRRVEAGPCLGLG